MARFKPTLAVTTRLKKNQNFCLCSSLSEGRKNKVHSNAMGDVTFFLSQRRKCKQTFHITHITNIHRKEKNQMKVVEARDDDRRPCVVMPSIKRILGINVIIHEYRSV